MSNRGTHDGRDDFGTYAQDHISAFEQDTMVGHAVRAVLLANGLSYFANVSGKEEAFYAAENLWRNAVHKKMHISGSVGAIAAIEGFGDDYFLPNDAYLETCAAISMCFLHNNMNKMFANAKYADMFELALYNGALGHISHAGNK